jgi:hypothetical protein
MDSLLEWQGREDHAFSLPCKGDAEAGKELSAKVEGISTIGRQHLRLCCVHQSVTATVHKADRCRSADTGSLVCQFELRLVTQISNFRCTPRDAFYTFAKLTGPQAKAFPCLEQ